MSTVEWVTEVIQLVGILIIAWAVILNSRSIIRLSKAYIKRYGEYR